MSETCPSPFTCAKCGKRIMWERIEFAPGSTISSVTEPCWSLNVPCACGSQLFNVVVEHPRAHCQVYGINA
jgi:hypothetical protein